MKQPRLFFIFIVILMTFLGCTRQESRPNSSSVSAQPAPQHNGGVDGSGGETGLSTIEQVRLAHERAKPVILQALIRLKRIVETSEAKELDSRWSSERLRLLNGILSGTELVKTSALDLFQSNGIDWTTREDNPCDSTHGPSDGAAKSPNSICVSFKRLTRFSYRDLDVRLIQLYAHELGHLYFGEAEELAVELAALFTEIPELVFPNTGRIRDRYERLAEMVAEVEGLSKPSDSPCLTQMLEHYSETSWLPLLQKLDPEIYYSAEFLRHMQPMAEYMSHVIKVPADKRSESCKADPATYYAYTKRDNMLKEAKIALNTFAEFYVDVLGPSESKPVDIQAGK